MVSAAEPFFEIDKYLFCYKKYVAFWTFDFFHKNVLKHDLIQGYFFIFGLNHDNN